MRIGIPLYNGVDLLDVTGPCEMFDWAGFEVENFLAEKPGAIAFRTKGFSCEATLSFEQARKYDAIWVPGGEPQALADIIEDQSGPSHDFLRAQLDHVTFMCSAARVRRCWRGRAYSMTTARQRIGTF